MTSKNDGGNSSIKKKDVSGGYTTRQLTIGFAKEPPLFFADKPSAPCFRSDVWKYFSFIYQASAGEVVPHWYRCDVPNCQQPFQNICLKDGNKKLHTHIDRHDLDDQPVQLTKNQLVDALVEASRIGQESGQIAKTTIQSVFQADDQNIWSELLMKRIGALTIASHKSDDSNNVTGPSSGIKML